MSVATLRDQRVGVIGGGSGIGFAVAEAARAHVCSMKGSYTTGQVLVVDGGLMRV